ncbi:hypothetical protein PENTCL1PPCAC_3302, partial [Pristionchus entomophagus]
KECHLRFHVTSQGSMYIYNGMPVGALHNCVDTAKPMWVAVAVCGGAKAIEFVHPPSSSTRDLLTTLVAPREFVDSFG